MKTIPIQNLPVRKVHFFSFLDARWETISIDFVVELLESAGFDVVMTIINLVFKIIYFIPMYTMVSLKGIARLFLHNLWKHYGLSTYVVSNLICCSFYKRALLLAWNQSHLLHCLIFTNRQTNRTS